MIASAMLSGEVVMDAEESAVDAPPALSGVSGSPSADGSGRVTRWMRDTKADDFVSGFVVYSGAAPVRAAHGPGSLRPMRPRLAVPLARSNVLADAATFTGR